ncbi:MAG: 3-oxoacyl-ACP synthase III family protein [Myxococcota bacterium]
MSLVVAGTGSCLPVQRITNRDLEERIDTSDAWIVERTGIRERRRVAPGEATSHLATRAAEAALASAGIEASDLDGILVCTVSPDMLTPATAAFVHRNLGVGRPIPCFDLNAACTGFIYGLEVAAGLMASDRYHRVLVIGAEAITRFIDVRDRATCILFGDAAGAVVLERSERPGGLLSTLTKADGAFWDLIQIPGGGSLDPPTARMVDERRPFVRMNGRQVFKLAVQALEQVARDQLEQVGWKIADVDHLLVHQANARIIEAVVARLGIPGERVHRNIERTGNTSSATLPTLLDEARRAGRLHAGDRILCAAFGAGLTWGSAALEWTGTRR